ncbi:hypothetical protein BU23DRAFT_573219 [Bimuria novae-zelandiae CBS 107.79]|uniref:Uncharacterized protein n=1 Tax=Bimuria novae-zelandiae CBS 107.79 TaxID=1447943 RepID=A0A6A5USY8_9PLEO|nr:hypothetical protein BU23DRAFT_573219 [Bimuria novae-zelandiae CBS 107.79]
MDTTRGKRTQASMEAHTHGCSRDWKRQYCIFSYRHSSLLHTFSSTTNPLTTITLLLPIQSATILEIESQIFALRPLDHTIVDLLHDPTVQVCHFISGRILHYAYPIPDYVLDFLYGDELCTLYENIGRNFRHSPDSGYWKTMQNRIIERLAVLDDVLPARLLLQSGLADIDYDPGERTWISIWENDEGIHDLTAHDFPKLITSVCMSGFKLPTSIFTYESHKETVREAMIRQNNFRQFDIWLDAIDNDRPVPFIRRFGKVLRGDENAYIDLISEVDWYVWHANPQNPAGGHFVPYPVDVLDENRFKRSLQNHEPQFMLLDVARHVISDRTYDNGEKRILILEIPRARVAQIIKERKHLEGPQHARASPSQQDHQVPIPPARKEPAALFDVKPDSYWIETIQDVPELWTTSTRSSVKSLRREFAELSTMPSTPPNRTPSKDSLGAQKKAGRKTIIVKKVQPKIQAEKINPGHSPSREKPAQIDHFLNRIDHGTDSDKVQEDQQFKRRPLDNPSSSRHDWVLRDYEFLVDLPHGEIQLLPAGARAGSDSMAFLASGQILGYQGGPCGHSSCLNPLWTSPLQVDYPVCLREYNDKVHGILGPGFEAKLTKQALNHFLTAHRREDAVLLYGLPPGSGIDMLEVPTSLIHFIETLTEFEAEQVASGVLLIDWNNSWYLRSRKTFPLHPKGPTHAVSPSGGHGSTTFGKQSSQQPDRSIQRSSTSQLTEFMKQLPSSQLEGFFRGELTLENTADGLRIVPAGSSSTRKASPTDENTILKAPAVEKENNAPKAKTDVGKTSGASKVKGKQPMRETIYQPADDSVPTTYVPYRPLKITVTKKKIQPKGTAPPAASHDHGAGPSRTPFSKNASKTESGSTNSHKKSQTAHFAPPYSCTEKSNSDTSHKLRNPVPTQTQALAKMLERLREMETELLIRDNILEARLDQAQSTQVQNEDAGVGRWDSTPNRGPSANVLQTVLRHSTVTSRPTARPKSHSPPYATHGSRVSDFARPATGVPRAPRAVSEHGVPFGPVGNPVLSRSDGINNDWVWIH